MLGINTNNKMLPAMIAGALCWAYIITNNVRVIPLALL